MTIADPALLFINECRSELLLFLNKISAVVNYPNKIAWVGLGWLISHWSEDQPQTSCVVHQNTVQILTNWLVSDYSQSETVKTKPSLIFNWA